MAFKDSEKGAILTKEVDNSASTTSSSSNPYICENTFDKIYILSYKDLYNSNYGFTDNSSRCAKVTDYAKAVGAYWYTEAQYLDNGKYFLSSYHSDTFGFYVDIFGQIFSTGHVYDTDYGVRVACAINLE